MGKAAQPAKPARTDFCNAYPLACAGVSALRLAHNCRGRILPPRRLPASRRHIPAGAVSLCTASYCNLFEEIPMERDGRAE
jgi:hypothetical protein